MFVSIAVSITKHEKSHSTSPAALFDSSTDSSGRFLQHRQAWWRWITSSQVWWQFPCNSQVWCRLIPHRQLWWRLLTHRLHWLCVCVTHLTQVYEVNSLNSQDQHPEHLSHPLHPLKSGFCIVHQINCKKGSMLRVPIPHGKWTSSARTLITESTLTREFSKQIETPKRAQQRQNYLCINCRHICKNICWNYYSN